MAAQGAERESRIAAELAEAGDSERQLEEAALEELLLPLGYTVRDIQARIWLRAGRPAPVSYQPWESRQPSMLSVHGAEAWRGWRTLVSWKSNAAA